MPTKLKEPLKKGDATRLQIEDAALSLFMDQGYHATSMRQIAEKAGLALGGIYNHFASKEEIFAAIVIDKHPYKKILPLVLATQGDTVEEFLQNAARIVITELSKESLYINLMLIELIEFNGRHGAQMLTELAPKVLPVFEKLVKDRKSLRVLNPAVLMRYFFGMILSYFITERIIADSLVSNLMPKNIIDVYVDLCLHGIIKASA